MEINVIEFINKRKEELDSFASDWLLNHKNDPDNWPLYLPRQDWDEQEHFGIEVEE